MTKGTSDKGALSPSVPRPAYLLPPRDGPGLLAEPPPAVPSSAGTRGAGLAAKGCEDEKRGLPETRDFQASQHHVINQMSKALSKVSFDRQGNLSNRSFCCPRCFSVSLCPSVYLGTSPFRGRGGTFLLGKLDQLLLTLSRALQGWKWEKGRGLGWEL